VVEEIIDMTQIETQEEFSEIEKGLDGEYEEEIEVVGDIHNTDVGSYVEALDSKYDEGPDAVLAVGDLASAEGHDGVESADQYGGMVDENLTQLNEIGVDVYFVPGNHDAVEGANPGQGMVDELGADYLDQIAEDLENVHNLEYDSAEIGDLTVVGGSHHLRPEIPEQFRGEPDLEDFGYDLEDIANELEGGQSHDYGFWSDIPVIGSIVEYVGDFLGYGQEEVSPEDLEIDDIPEDILEEQGNYEELQEYLEMKQEFEEVKASKKEKLDELLDEAGENVIVLDHGMPFGGDADSDIDYMGEEAGHQGSLVWNELLQEHDVDSFYGGHFHGKGGEKDEIHGTEVYNIGPGQYLEAGYEAEGVEDTFHYDQTMLGGEQYQREPQEEQDKQEELKRAASLIQRTGGVDNAINEVIEPQLNELVDEGQMPEDMKEEIMQNEREKLEEVNEMMESEGPNQEKK
jgi:Icc-related predicted phosphoesterase